MKVRRAARRIALDVLYEAEIRDCLPRDALELRVRDGWLEPAAGEDEDGAPDVPAGDALAYAEILVAGVQDHQADLDHLIAGYADRWTIERMPVIDRNLLRMAVYELLWGTDVPVAVAINEAVELAKEMSTDDSGRFVNGLLGRIAERERPA
jgi:N utilization substance protein B